MKYWETESHLKLQKQSDAFAENHHLRNLLQCEDRCQKLTVSHDGLHLDCTRELIDLSNLQLLLDMYRELNVPAKIKQMYAGEKINVTENRAVLHVALRCNTTDTYHVDGIDVTHDVLEVRGAIDAFTTAVRNGVKKGHSGKHLVNVVCIGIGGSYLGVEFVHEAFRTYEPAKAASRGRLLRFLANVDPIDISRAFDGLDLEETLVVIISKTFTTAETMLNAKTVKDMFLKHYKGDAKCIEKHVCAVSTNLEGTSKFGIDTSNVFGFWDWVGGRYSVCSAVGLVPLSLQYGTAIVEEFLAGARDIDQHFKAAPVEANLPALMGLISFYNATYLRLNTVAILPYCQALLRFPAHIQQLTMESNGKRVCADGTPLPNLNGSGEVFFGEPGTNGQHSFYQLIHQGQTVPCEFIGFTKSQQPVALKEAPVSNHDELMSNFFAQSDALALGRGIEELKGENVPNHLLEHKKFMGNKPSLSILIEGACTPRRVGQLLALYEHRTATEGFMWGINSFDQWGVELGKVLAKRIREVMQTARSSGNIDAASVPVAATKKLLEVYFKQ